MALIMIIDLAFSANPVCENAPGCGDWKAAQIKNPLYKGKWRPEMIENPDYQVCFFDKLIDYISVNIHSAYLL